MAIQKVNLGDQTFDIEVYDIPGNDGKTILITGGMDGDEYTGMEAAYQLKERFLESQNPGRLIILPCVNIPGFEKSVSWNPKDRKFPKYIYPGNPHGSSTERLIAWVSEYVHQADIWLDLHAGAMHESLTPCVLAYETENRDVNTETVRIMAALDTPILVYQKKNTIRRIENIAKEQVTYLMFESGGEGSRAESDIARHVQWVEQVLNKVWKKEDPDVVNELKMPDVFRTLSYIQAQNPGYFSPVKFCNDDVTKGELVGYILSQDKKRTQTILSPTIGKILWNSVAVTVGKGDELFGIASA